MHCVYVVCVVYSHTMNKTLYIRDEDTPVWDRARELAGDKLSPIIVAGLKRFIAEKEAEEAESKGFGRIEVSYNDADHHRIPKRKAFTGKWIYTPDEPLQLGTEEGDRTYSYAIAQTAKHNFGFLSWVEDWEGKGNYRFQVFPSLEAAASDNDLNTAARQAIKKLGIAVEELDI
jgi:hypothetical protein